jgi:hypothetical protein
MADLPESLTRRNVDLVHESASKSLEAAAARGKHKFLPAAGGGEGYVIEIEWCQFTVSYLMSSCVQGQHFSPTGVLCPMAVLLSRSKMLCMTHKTARKGKGTLN